MTSVLYDVPGPRAVARNRLLGVLTVVVVVALLGFVIYRFAESGQFSPTLWNSFTYGQIWANIFSGLLATLSAFLVAAVGSLVLAFALAMGRLSDHAWLRVPVALITELFRAVPVVVMMMFFYYGVNSLGIVIDGDKFTVEPYWGVVLALILYNGSVLAEALRAGVESLPRGQKEAGFAIGLRKAGVMWFILLPQAVRAMLPVIMAQLVVALKDTAIGFAITYHELLYWAKTLAQNLPGHPYVPSGIVIGAIYIGLCLILAGIAKIIEVRMAKSPRSGSADAAEEPAPNEALMHVGTETEVIATQVRRKR